MACTYMPEPLALGALHPTAAGLRLSRRQVRPELGLCHGQQGRGRNREVVVVVVLRLVRRLVLRLRRRLVLRGRLERGLLLGLERGLLLGLRLRLVWGRQGGVPGPLPCQKRQKKQFRISIDVSIQPFPSKPQCQKEFHLALKFHFVFADEGSIISNAEIS